MSDDTAGVQRALGDAYLLERLLGRGGMGAVYLARDTRLHRQVAIKVLPPELSQQADLRERFIRETQVAASFSHPNIVPVHAIEERGDLLAFVMGFVDGETLTARIRRAPLAVADAVRILQEVAWALSYAHGRGIVHRDIKPDNILVERSTGRAMVTDFGIARAVSTLPGAGLTRVGEVVGTPEFMSPEQASGDVVDGRSDIYSLGVVAFFALTGVLPFEADSATALFAMHLTQAPPPLLTRRADLPDDLVNAIDRCLAKEPGARWESAEALSAALDGMRRSAPEIPAPVRIFLQRFTGAIGASGLLLFMALTLLSDRARVTSIDRLAEVVLVVACALGMLMSGLRRVRGVVQQGFRYRDVTAATAALVNEERSARDAIRASPAEMKRRRRNQRVAIMSLAWPLVALWVIRRWVRRPVPGVPGEYGLTRPAIVAAFAAAATFGLGIALLLSDPLKPNPFPRVQHLFWRGPLGRALFRLYGGAASVGREAGASTGALVARTGGAGTGARTLINTLPRELRQQVRDLPRQLGRLEAESEALATRERELEAAVREIGAPGAALAPSVHAAREAAAAEIRGHQADVVARREAIAARMERVRLELVRLRAGIGSADAVLRAACE